MTLFKKDASRRTRQPKIEDDSSGYTFRRSRTLSGSSSPNVKTTKSHADMQSSRLQSHRLKRRRRHVMAMLIVIIVLIAGTYWLMTQYAASATSISYSPSPQVTPNKARYQNIINKYLQAHPLERFRFVLNDARLSQYVSQALPEVAGIASNGGGIGYGSYKISLRKPVIDWRLGSREYLVDASGVAFSKNYYQKPAVSVIDKSSLAVSGGKEAIASNRLLAFLGLLVSGVNEAGLGQIESLTIPAASAREVDVRLKGESYFFKVNVSRDVAAQVQDMERVERYFKQHHATPQYIDLRVGGRAFYR